MVRYYHFNSSSKKKGHGSFLAKLLLWIIVILLAVLVFALFNREWVFDQMTQNLVVRDEPKKGDYVFVLSGNTSRRLPFGIQLLKEGWAPKIGIVISRKPPYVSELEETYGIDWSEERLSSLILEKEGIKEEDYTFLRDSLSTWNDIEKIRELYDTTPFSQALIVTDPPHSRRTMMCVEKLFLGEPVQFISYPSYPDEDFSQSFVEKNDYINFVFDEYFKIAYYYLRYISSLIPSDAAKQVSE